MATGENWEREGPSTRMVFSSMIVRPSPPTGAPVKREAAAHAVDQDEKHAQAAHHDVVQSAPDAKDGVADTRERVIADNAIVLQVRRHRRSVEAADGGLVE